MPSTEGDQSLAVPTVCGLSSLRQDYAPLQELQPAIGNLGDMTEALAGPNTARGIGLDDWHYFGTMTRIGRVPSFLPETPSTTTG